jgi:NAD(P)-dependent dehydrogenase (short-subunit alcohol dehydrogenase family)
MIDLRGQSVLVTGASRGIGAAIAETLAACGARVGVHYARGAAAAEALAARIGGGARAFRADLADPSAPAALWDEARDAFGGLDGLVNNAGIALASPLSAAEADWLADWERTMAVNLTASGLLCRRALADFAAGGGGRIVTIASRAAFRGDQPDYIAYAVSKAGLLALSRSIARGFGRQGVRAFVVAPGFTRTDMASAFIDQYGEDYAMNDIALERLTEPRDVAPVVAFLLSGLADHATGTSIDVNAGSYVR